MSGPDDAPAEPDAENSPTADALRAAAEADAHAERPSGDDELGRLRAERDKFLAIARRTQADFDNYQKRAKRDLETERRYAPGAAIADLLPVLDNLERALEAASAESGSGLIEGIELVRRQWLDVFAKHGVEPIATDGRPFDPNLHEALSRQPTDQYPPMTVMATATRGYTLHERVLRPAQVIVAAASDPGSPASSAPDGSTGA